jgi:hypothetical protein
VACRPRDDRLADRDEVGTAELLDEPIAVRAEEPRIEESNAEQWPSNISLKQTSDTYFRYQVHPLKISYRGSSPVWVCHTRMRFGYLAGRERTTMNAAIRAFLATYVVHWGPR